MDASLEHVTNAWWNLARRDAPPKRRTGVDATWHGVLGSIARASRPGRWYLARAMAIDAVLRSLADLTDDALSAQTLEVRGAVRRRTDDRILRERALVLLGEQARRTLGLCPHPNQLACALALLDGRIAELPTGEGKTLAIALAACVHGWRGRGCHVLTANDYLAQRDALDMAPLFHGAGLTVGAVTSTSAADDRREAYAAAITYSTAREVAADFLRDALAAPSSPTLAASLAARMTGGPGAPPDRLQRGLACAIIDEADALLIDEASTPLILAGAAPSPEASDLIARADSVARSLIPQRDFRIDAHPASVRLTARGCQRITETIDAARDPGAWMNTRRRQELVELALHAHLLLRRDEHYAVVESRVVIIDQYTGRLVPDRSWRAGLHQAVEAKEGLLPTPVKETLARTPFQRFFSRYGHLSGTTGTAREVRRELWGVYHLPVVTLASHERCQRTVRRAPALDSLDALLTCAADEAERAHATGRPILLGTRSVEISERLSVLLSARSLSHEVLSAVRHQAEAGIITNAGLRGAITIATNMAGRGTDIRLGDGVASLGGLLVICVETQESARLERQLLGRAARQGDPGEGVVLRSIEDGVLRRDWPALGTMAGASFEPVRTWIVRLARRASEVRARATRARVARDEDRAVESMEFAGPGP